MNNRQAQARPNFDTLCYNRLTSPNFAQPQNRLVKLIAKIKAGAK
ncbi:hypothetical protein [Alkanindiges illinoisensis]|nr:hypothetical protein [Alkanindiges illinoisensis]